MSNMHPGAIVLMHSGGHWTQNLSGMVQSLDTIIPQLKKEGVHFVTISQMLNIPDKK
ncbi:peptidoglycan/xylan/chitin deacetylase (PgdA/CDA1 family) [Paenibacillus sp. PvR052]